jgi:hypothetical protein
MPDRQSPHSSRTLIVFGDSWPAGAELANTDLSFPLLLADLLGTTVINAAEPGTSIDQAVFKFLTYFKNRGDPFFPWQKSGWFKQVPEVEFNVLFCITGKSRSWKITDDKTLEFHPKNTDIESVNYYKYIHTEEHAHYNLIKNVLLIQEICKRYNTPCYFVSNWESMPKFHMIDETKVYNKTLVEILDIQPTPLDYLGKRLAEPQANLISKFEKSRYIIPNMSHPNPSGHEKIAQELNEWIRGII